MCKHSPRKGFIREQGTLLWPEFEQSGIGDALLEPLGPPGLTSTLTLTLTLAAGGVQMEGGSSSFDTLPRLTGDGQLDVPAWDGLQATFAGGRPPQQLQPVRASSHARHVGGQAQNHDHVGVSCNRLNGEVRPRLGHATE